MTGDENARLARGALDSLSAHIAVLDGRGVILATNAAWRQFATDNGLTWQRVSEGMGYLAVCDSATGPSADEAAVMAAGIRDVMAGRRDHFTLEYPCHSPSEQRWFLARVSRFSVDASARTVVSHQDITARRVAEEARTAAQRRFESLFDLAPDAMVMTDRDGIIALVNRQAERIFGYDRREIVGQPIERLMPASGRAGHVALRQRYLRSAVPRSMADSRSRLQGMRKDGTQFPVEISLSPIETDQGPAVVAAVRDVSDRHRLESQLQQAQKMETVGQLAGGIAHDFNNLLSVINATADLAQLDLPVGHSVRGDLETIRAAGVRAVALTQRLLAFSRKQILQPVVVDLGATVAQMEPMLERLIREDISVTVQRGHDLWRTRVDPTQIEQVVLNLVVNARDAMPAGGRLMIETSNVILDDAYVRAHHGVRTGPYVCLTVSDTGVGMDESTQERIFEPFFTTKAMGKGTGLGLATAHGIVKQCGGDIWCYSEIGKGTSFKVYLPKVDGAVAEGQAAAPGSGVVGHETILVVEDDDAIRLVAERILTKHGYTVLLAAGGEEALRLLQEHGPPVHLVVTDVVMPGLSGREVAERITLSHPGAKILFTSGYTDNAIGHHGVLDEGVPFIAKPYSVQDLTRKVRAVLDS